MSKDIEKGPIIVTAGMWSTNIGNAFFQLGAAHIISQAAPDRHVHLLTDHAGYWQYGKKQEPAHSARLIDHVDAEYLVLSGSVLTYSFPSLWAKTFKICKEKKTRIILLGAGQFDYSKRETDICRELLDEFPPYIFVSRDSNTYDNFKDLAANAYNGIDNAYFLPLAYPKISLDYPPYIVLNFDKGPEPMCQMLADHGKYVWGKIGYNSCCVPFNAQAINIQFPEHKRLFSNWTGKYYGYLAGILGLKKTRRNQLDNYLLLRTDHQTNPLCHRKLYYGPGAFAMDIPYGYFALYGNAELTLSDRIHACIVTMAYGGTAMLFSKSPRVQIIEQVGANKILEQPTKLNLENLNKMRINQIEFLKSYID